MRKPMSTTYTKDQGPYLGYWRALSKLFLHGEGGEDLNQQFPHTRHRG